MFCVVQTLSLDVTHTWAFDVEIGLPLHLATPMCQHAVGETAALLCEAYRMDVLISPAQLADRMDDDADLRIVDCRFVLGQPDGGRQLYRERHIAGAAFLDLDDALADPVGDGRRGRHPLPSVQRFTQAAREAGISASSFVVAYDAGASGGAARLWWLLRHFGFDRVAVLDGGFAAWDGPTRSGDETLPRGDFQATVRSDDLVDVDDVAARLGRPGRVLIDARAPERFRGEVEPVDPVAGHIPGAVNVPFNEPLPDELVDDERDVVVYCGSGVTACEVLLRLAAQGRDAQLYAGSYSEWVNRGLPVERA